MMGALRPKELCSLCSPAVEKMSTRETAKLMTFLAFMESNVRIRSTISIMQFTDMSLSYLKFKTFRTRPVIDKRWSGEDVPVMLQWWHLALMPPHPPVPQVWTDVLKCPKSPKKSPHQKLKMWLFQNDGFDTTWLIYSWVILLQDFSVNLCICEGADCNAEENCRQSACPSGAGTLMLSIGSIVAIIMARMAA